MTSELTNKSPNDLRILLDTIKLRRNELLLSDADSAMLKSLVVWEEEVEQAFNDVMFERRRISNDNFGLD